MNPPIVPLIAFNTPAFVTLNGANPKVLLPNCIPSSASATNKSVEDGSPNVILLPEASISKFVAVRLSPLIVNPQSYQHAVIVPAYQHFHFCLNEIY